MPFYEYRRPDGTTIEVMHKMTDPPLTEDPETGVPLERVFHPIAVHFKGKGFYNTDYGTKKRQREKAAETEGKTSSDKGESGASDSAGGETKSESTKAETTSSEPSTSSSPSSSKPSSASSTTPASPAKTSD